MARGKKASTAKRGKRTAVPQPTEAIATGRIGSARSGGSAVRYEYSPAAAAGSSSFSSGTGPGEHEPKAGS